MGWDFQTEPADAERLRWMQEFMRNEVLPLEVLAPELDEVAFFTHLRSLQRQVKDAGLDKVHFAYTGGANPGQPHTYRVQGPTFVIEFLNAQADSAGNPANHIHSCWRELKGDFGLGTN